MYLSYETLMTQSIETKIKTKENLTNDEVSWIIETVLDTLIEVGNGVTDEELHHMADYMFAIRDQWFNNII